MFLGIYNFKEMFMKKKVSESNPIPVKIVSMADVTEEQIASGEIGSAYSNAEIDLRKRLSQNEGRISREADLIQADLDAEFEAMTETERQAYERRERASARRLQKELAKDMGVPFSEIDGIFGYYFNK